MKQCRSSGSRQEAVIIAYTARQQCTSSWSWQEAEFMSAVIIPRNEQKSYEWLSQAVQI
jgi:hypothetical protein